MKIDIPKTWCEAMAKLEDGQEVGAGAEDHPLRDIRTAYSSAMDEAGNETADFICAECGKEVHDMPMRAYLEHGEPDCPDMNCPGPTSMIRARKTETE